MTSLESAIFCTRWTFHNYALKHHLFRFWSHVMHDVYFWILHRSIRLTSDTFPMKLFSNFHVQQLFSKSVSIFLFSVVQKCELIRFRGTINFLSCTVRVKFIPSTKLSPFFATAFRICHLPKTIYFLLHVLHLVLKWRIFSLTPFFVNQGPISETYIYFSSHL